MENILISNVTSIFSTSDASQEHCTNFTKEYNHFVQNVNISAVVICTLEFLAGLTVSGYVIWMKVYRLEKTFRSVLSLNLFISGFFWSLFLLLNIVHFANGINWPFGLFMCRLNNFMFHVNMFISAFILTLYSIDYCFVVMWPLKYNVYRRPHLASVEALVFWIIAVCLSIPSFFFKSTYECISSSKCTHKFGDSEIWKHHYKAMGIITFIFGYLIPLLIMFSCFIITALVYHRKKTSKYTPALKMIFMFQTVFVVCWLPYHVCFLISLSLPSLNILETVQPIILGLASLSGAVNPILYVFISPDFRKILPKYVKQPDTQTIYVKRLDSIYILKRLNVSEVKVDLPPGR